MNYPTEKHPGLNDRVRLTEGIPNLWLDRGDIGVVASNWGSSPDFCEVEFQKNAGSFKVRALVQAEHLEASDDFVKWSEPKLITPDAIDDTSVKEPDQRTEFYGMIRFAYGNQYLGMTPVLRIQKVQEETEALQSRIDGPMEAQLISSRDGLNWH